MQPPRQQPRPGGKRLPSAGGVALSLMHRLLLGCFTFAARYTLAHERWP